MWLSKDRNGKEILSPDDEWEAVAKEDEIIAEVDSRGILQMSETEAEALLKQLSAGARNELVTSTLVGELQHLEPTRWEELLAKIALESTAVQSALLTTEGKLEEWAASHGSRMDDEADHTMLPSPGPDASQRPKIRPIQMGEFLRKFTCKRLLSLDKLDVAAVSASLRQFGCGIPGGAEAVIHFRKIVMDLWKYSDPEDSQRCRRRILEQCLQ